MGFLGADAESRATRDGVPFTVLSLATKRSWKDGRGIGESRTYWHRVVGVSLNAPLASSTRAAGFLRRGTLRFVLGLEHVKPLLRLWYGLQTQLTVASGASHEYI
jgi:single-stranded DNA-binding protein